MAIVILEHALGTDQLVTVSAEELDLSFLVHVAVDSRVVGYLCMRRFGWHYYVLRPY